MVMMMKDDGDRIEMWGMNYYNREVRTRKDS
jgi:hypothetical protein